MWKAWLGGLCVLAVLVYNLRLSPQVEVAEGVASVDTLVVQPSLVDTRSGNADKIAHDPFDESLRPQYGREAAIVELRSEAVASLRESRLNGDSRTTATEPVAPA